MFSQRIILIFSFVLIINPSIIFILKNIHYYPFFDLINPLILSLIIFFILSIFFLFYKVNLKYFNVKKIIIFFTLLWSFQFYYLNIINLIGLQKHIHFYPKLILVFSIFFLSFLISFYIKRVIIIFFINLNILLLLFTFIYTYSYNFVNFKKEEKVYETKYFNIKEYKWHI